MSFLKIQNLNISYKISGQGQKILLLHGWGTDLSYFNDLVKLLVADEFQVVAVDLPGFGRSDSLDQGWSVDDYADFTNEFINNLNINDCYLLGHSFGGRIGIKLAAGQPDWLKGLILVNSA
ncbi:MAG TPA: alpha/beta hydrolase, partial [Patescibacteria group bacterium]